MNSVLKVAKEFPDVKFEHATGYKTSKNVKNYTARFYEGRYLAGMLAAATTKTNILGYVAALPIPEVFQGINAYTLGARAVNPNIEVRVVWTSSWYDPGKEADAMQALDNVNILCETSLQRIFEYAEEINPEIMVIDSIQTIATEEVDSSPGSITQVRECAAALLRFAKTSGTPVILIGHINKEGTLAGPKILEHIVDTVIQFEGDQHYMYRILRSIKNRFGSTSELGIYEMQQTGLRQVSNPSELLLSQDHEGLSGVAISSAIEGVRPFLVETQALVSTAAYGTPQRSATGFDQRRLNMLLAVLEKRVGFKLVQKDVFVNIAGGLRVTDLAMDLSVIAAVLSSNVDTAIEPGWCMAGEVGLSGEVRPINRIEQRIAEAEKLGFTDIILPRHNIQGLDTSKYRINIHPVRKVEEALRELFG